MSLVRRFLSIIVLVCCVLSFSSINVSSNITPQQVLVEPISNSPDGASCEVVQIITCKVNVAVLADQSGETLIYGNTVTITNFSHGITMESMYTNMDSVNPSLEGYVTQGDQIGTLSPGEKLFVSFFVNNVLTNPNGWWLHGQPYFTTEYVGGFWDNSKTCQVSN